MILVLSYPKFDPDSGYDLSIMRSLKPWVGAIHEAAFLCLGFPPLA